MAIDASLSSINTFNTITAADLQNMDLETALMAVQSDRCTNLDNSIKLQLGEVSKRNQLIASLNKALVTVNGLGNDYKGWSIVPDNIARELDANGITGSNRHWTQDTSKELKGKNIVGHNEIKLLSDSIQKTIDSLNSTQQMDMQRLQSLTSRRNETFEIMTTLMKKFADSRSGIIRNM